MFMRSPAILLVVAIAAMALAGCYQQVFVGLPNASRQAQSTPPPIVETDKPPLASVDVPTLNPIATLNRPLPIGEAPLQLQTVSGPPFAWSQTENYLVLGTDRRSSSDSWRTDTIMVVGLDRANRRAAVLSVPRDLYVEIPNYGLGRINQVDYIGERIARVEGGGPALVSEVLSRTLGIGTRNWVRFEMTGFKSVVDAVGGVDVYLDCPFYEPILNLDTNAWEYFTLPAGDNHLDGESAYWFVRLRLRESDIGRGQRQRQFLWALREKASKTNLILRFPELWSAFRDSFSTDLSLLQIIELGQLAISLDPASVRAGGISLRELQSFTTEQGASVLRITDPEAVRAVIEGIWSAPAMVDAYRQDASNCAAVPQGSPFLAENQEPVTAPAPVADEAAAEAAPGDPAAGDPAAPVATPPAVEAANAGNAPGEGGG